MPRYWVSWWSGYYAREGCTKPPFQIWVTGSRYREPLKQEDEMSGENDLSICAVIDAETPEMIEAAIQKHFPDREMRFMNLVADDYTPGDRFPDFKNQTKIT